MLTVVAGATVIGNGDGHAVLGSSVRLGTARVVSRPTVTENALFPMVHVRAAASRETYASAARTTTSESARSGLAMDARASAAQAESAAARERVIGRLGSPIFKP